MPALVDRQEEKEKKCRREEVSGNVIDEEEGF